MTPVKVVDSSALAALLFGEAEGPTIAARLAGAKLIAPALLHFELANVCLNKIKRNPAQREILWAAFGYRKQFAIQEIAIDHEASLALAEATGLTAYDAAYLWLSQSRTAELVTLDKALLTAFSKM